MSKTASTAGASPASPASVSLETPIQRGDQAITTLQLRKPSAGELRGVALSDLLRLDVSALIAVLPRITTPTLTAPDVAAMDVADLTTIGVELLGFFASKAEKAAYFLETSRT